MFRELLDVFPNRPTTREARFFIEKMRKFQLYAERMNRGEALVSNPEYYHRQADYVDRVLVPS